MAETDRQKITRLERDNQDLRDRVDRLHDTAGEILRAMRDEDGTCRICHAPRGEPHRKPCEAWPLIEARYGVEPRSFETWASPRQENTFRRLLRECLPRIKGIESDRTAEFDTTDDGGLFGDLQSLRKLAEEIEGAIE